MHAQIPLRPSRLGLVALIVLLGVLAPALPTAAQEPVPAANPAPLYLPLVHSGTRVLPDDEPAGGAVALSFAAEEAALAAIAAAPGERATDEPEWNPGALDGLAVEPAPESAAAVGEPLTVPLIAATEGRAAPQLAGTGGELFSQETLGLPGTAELDDHFGDQLASADFNGDGWADLAVGIPNETVGGLVGAGAVQLLFGRAGGLAVASNQLITLDMSGVPGAAQEGAHMGSALAVGDFDRNGYPDLAVGVPGQDVDLARFAGAVLIFFSTREKPLHGEIQFVTQATAGVPGTAEDRDSFGAALAAGDFDADGYDDLAIGTPTEDAGAVADAGEVTLLRGSEHLLVPAGATPLSQDAEGVGGVSEAADFFGDALAVGDFDRDGFADLAVGVPFEAIGAAGEAGAVNLFYGAPGGLRTVGSQLWSQDVAGVADSSEAMDHFGLSLAAGDFSGDGRDDLAVGVPHEEVGALSDSGAVHLFFGGATGLVATRNQLVHEGSTNVPGEPGDGEHFGYVLAAGQMSAGKYVDLIVGNPHERVGSVYEAGAVLLIHGLVPGEQIISSELHHQDRAGVPGDATDDALFGVALAVGDFDGDLQNDLAVGAPGTDINGLDDAGAVITLYAPHQALCFLPLAMGAAD